MLHCCCTAIFLEQLRKDKPHKRYLQNPKQCSRSPNTPASPNHGSFYKHIIYIHHNGKLPRKKKHRGANQQHVLANQISEVHRHFSNDFLMFWSGLPATTQALAQVTWATVLISFHFNEFCCLAFA